MSARIFRSILILSLPPSFLTFSPALLPGLIQALHLKEERLVVDLKEGGRGGGKEGVIF